MTILLIVSALFMLGSLLAFHVQFRRDTVEERLRLSSRILEIEAENRRLTESLCMSQGKAYIPVQKELGPARTWYDAPPEIEFHAKLRDLPLKPPIQVRDFGSTESLNG